MNSMNLGRSSVNNQKIESKPKKSKKFLKGFILLALIFSLGVVAGQENIVRFNIFDDKKQSSDNALPSQLDYESVEEVYDELKGNFDGNLDQAKLIDGLKEGLVEAAGDPHSEYLSAEENKDFQEGLSGSFEGIGAELGKEEDSIVIVSPIAGFPAEKAGVKPKDIVIEINGESAQNFSISEAVEKIRGPKGTKVKLSVLREGKRLDFEITREQITVPSVTSEVVSNDIGVIKLSRFGEDSVDLVNKSAQDLKAKKVRGIILDMRNNPGGLLDASVGISEVWLPKGTTILEEKRGDKVIKTYLSKGNPILSGVKTVVLINEGSASASEIVAGALKDNKAATIIGVKSYGKGSVQEVKDLRFGGALKVTIARWFTPGGRNIDQEGIEPDQKVELTDADAEAKKDPQKDTAINFLKQL